MAEFKGVSEKFNLQIVDEDGHGSERAVVQIGLDGMLIRSSDGQRTLRKYPLSHISRWSMRNTSLVLYTKTPVDVEERTITLQASEGTIRSVLDTLTSCCMQMCELLESSNSSSKQQEASSISNLLSGGSRKKASLPAQEDVEFWNKPEKAGWLQSQGEHLRTWRRRWFVLKQGFLFRFSDQNVVAGSKPRGIVDLSKVTDVGSGRDVTGKTNSLTLSTATGAVHYLADSETEQVEWMSALEGAVAKIVRAIAGVEDEEPAATPKAKASGSGRDRSWAEQLEKSFAQHSVSGGGDGAARRDDRSTMVNIVGYDNGASAPPARQRSGSRHEQHRAPSSYGGTDYGGGGGDYNGSISYGQIAGLAGVAGAAPASAGGGGYAEPSYGAAAYPTLQPHKEPAPGYGYAGGGGGAGPSDLGSYGSWPQPAGPTQHSQQAEEPRYSQPAGLPYGQPDFAPSAAGSAGQPDYGFGAGRGYGQPQLPQQHQPQHQPAYQPAQDYQGYAQQPQPAPQQHPVHQQQPGAYASQPQGQYGSQHPQYAAHSGQAEVQAYQASQQADQQPQPQYAQPQAAAQPQPASQQVAPAAPVAPSSEWQVHYTGEGKPYYHHAQSGTTQWERPAGMA